MSYLCILKQFGYNDVIDQASDPTTSVAPPTTVDNNPRPLAVIATTSGVSGSADVALVVPPTTAVNDQPSTSTVGGCGKFKFNIFV